MFEITYRFVDLGKKSRFELLTRWVKPKWDMLGHEQGMLDS